MHQRLLNYPILTLEFLYQGKIPSITNKKTSTPNSRLLTGRSQEGLQLDPIR
jgi:hypothetical protein